MRGTQALYVIILCVVSLNNLAVTHWFLSTNVNRHLSKAYRNEFNKLKNLDEEIATKYEGNILRNSVSQVAEAIQAR
jgi:hypothetical protein